MLILMGCWVFVVVWKINDERWAYIPSSSPLWKFICLFIHSFKLLLHICGPFIAHKLKITDKGCNCKIESLIIILSVCAVHQLSHTVQGTSISDDGGFDYDQSWICVMYDLWHFVVCFFFSCVHVTVPFGLFVSQEKNEWGKINYLTCLAFFEHPAVLSEQRHFLTEVGIQILTSKNDKYD